MILAHSLRRSGLVDPYFSQVGLFLPFDQNFNDVGPNRFVPIITGTPTIISGPWINQTFYGGAGDFDGTESLTFDNEPELDIGTGDFTIEVRFQTSATAGNRGLVSHGLANNGYAIRVVSDGSVEFNYGSSSTITTPAGFVDWNLNSFYYYKIGREGGVMKRSYAKRPGGGPFTPPDGWQATVNTELGSIGYDFSTTSDLLVGMTRSAVNNHIGRLDEMRITVGRWRDYGRQITPHPKR